MARKKKEILPYRSNFEWRIAEYLKNNKVKFDYESESVAYVRPVRKAECNACGSTDVGASFIYTPDFVLANGVYIEAKGRFVSRDRTKLIAVLTSNNVLTRDNFRLLFMADNYTTSRKIERYSEWATRNGIICHVSYAGQVPKGWLKCK